MFIDYHLRPRALSFLFIAPILAPFFLQRFGVLSMTSTDAALSSSLPTSPSSRTVSGRCLCGAVTWSISESETASMTGTQVLVCHCDYCRRQSGSWYIPWLAVPRAALRQTLGNQNPAVSEYNSSKIAKRGFCRHCGSTLYMDYFEKHTIWVAMGTLQVNHKRNNNNDVSTTFCPARDSHIYVKGGRKQQEDKVAKILPQYPDFGSYRPDPCQPATSWRDIPTWRQVDTIATFAREQEKKKDNK